MSIRAEQYHSLKYVRELLMDCLDPKKRPKSQEAMKQRIFQALRHFPPLEENGKPIFSKDSST